MSREYKLLPGVRIERDDDEFVVSKLDDKYRISPELPETFDAVIRRLETGAAVDDLEADYDTDLAGVVDWLEKKRIVGVAGTATTRHERIVAAQAGYENLEDAVARIELATVGRVGLPQFDSLFEQHEVSRQDLLNRDIDDDIDLLLIIDERVDALTEVNEAVADSEIAAMYGWTDGHSLCVGPFFVPGMSACVNCLKHQLNYSPSSVVSMACETFPLESYTPVFLRDAYRYLGQFQYPDTRDAIIEIDMTTNQHTQHSVFKIPNCEYCGTKTVVDR